MDTVKCDNERDRERLSASRRNTMANSLTNASPSSIHIMANNSNNMNTVYNGNTSLIPTMNEMNSSESTVISSSSSGGATASSSLSLITGNTSSSNISSQQQQQTSGVIHKNVANSSGSNRIVHLNSACLNNFIIPVLSDVRHYLLNYTSLGFYIFFLFLFQFN